MEEAIEYVEKFAETPEEFNRFLKTVITTLRKKVLDLELGTTQRDDHIIDLKQQIVYLKSAPLENEEMRKRATWTETDRAQFRQIAEDQPVFANDLVSKESRERLIDWSMVVEDMEGLHTLTQTGRDVWKWWQENDPPPTP